MHTMKVSSHIYFEAFDNSLMVNVIHEEKINMFMDKQQEIL